jgi:hypothetical protein
MKVKRKDLEAMMEAATFSGSERWTDEKMVKQLEELPELEAEVEKEIKKAVKAGDADKSLLKLFHGVLKALENEEEIEITGGKASSAPTGKNGKKGKKGKKAKVEEEDDEEEDEDSEEEEDEDEDEEDSDSEDDDEEDEKPRKKKGKKGKVKAGKNGKAKKGNPKFKKGEQPEHLKRAQATNTNGFGHRTGTTAHRIDQAFYALAKDKAVTLEKVWNKADYDKPRHGHVRGLIEKKGFLERKGDNKYQLTKSGIKAWEKWKAKKAAKKSKSEDE